MIIDDKKFYGSTTVGEKGQIVLPADLRKDLDIKTGDKIAVMVMRQAGIPGIVLFQANTFTKLLDSFFGGKLEEFIEDKFVTEKVK